MKYSPLIAFIAGVVGLTQAQAQTQANAPAQSASGGAYQSGVDVRNVNTAVTVYDGASVVMAGGGGPITTSGTSRTPTPFTGYAGGVVITGGWTSAPTVPYGSGAHPNLQTALIDLSAALDQLNRANPTDKGDYLTRAITGVQMAIADVKWQLDYGDGVPTPPTTALPSLPLGVGNESSGLEVVPTKILKTASPNMDAAIAGLNKVLGEIKLAGPWNSGVFLPRATADVNFAIDNANAAINLANGQPPSQPKSAKNPAVASQEPSSPDSSKPLLNFGTTEIVGVLVVSLILICIAVEQIVRARGRG